MLQITLPDRTQKQFEKSVTALDVAESISPNLAKATVAALVNDQLVDAFLPIEKDATLKLITDRDDASLEIIRHSTAHLLAHAVKTLFPSAQVTIGPVIEDGFYYDFAFGRPFTPEDLIEIEKKMEELAKKNSPVTRKKISRNDAMKLFEKMGEHYKVQIIRDIPENETLTIYEQDNFVDLCRGPHVPRTGLLKAFKLTKLAGAYWRGDSKNEMLQRIYGTAWQDQKKLKEYLARIEEAKKRDHREIAKKMDLFHLQPEAPGMIFWHPNGWTMINVMRDYIRNVLRKSGYQEINTPQLVDVSLWERSGHMSKFDAGIFITESENRQYAVKPMSCPCHIQVFNQGIKSYRDLPIRYAEFGCCHRNEPSGTLHGIMRVRAMVQDDGHIFCTENQIQKEVSAFITQLHQVYKDFGFTDIIYKLALRPEKRVGSDAVWDKAEKALADALEAKHLQFDLLPGEGAFYGPKIEFHLRDCLGRMWQCGTIQVDFALPERLDACYIAENGEKKVPVMLHRAILGTFERFLGILIEHYAGHFPVWLAPVQAVVMNITDNQQEYVDKVTKTLQNAGFRVVSDLRNEKINFKIREHTIARVPYLLVAGDREVENASISVRKSDNEQSEVMTLDELIRRMQHQPE
ncbi:MAG: threonine--tRNA ligase [Gammaproteobacteria bacterium RIFCSPLOWO2_02_FULL_42_14]|nr:MAG: threonine--tRNA ligase [Gammaproteobacteria bacterium RIFCSPHIGHO2_02_FULL_42_43]OGT29169.1 MAG: threonine--tRNA ligase [Gammaproteobacteria bacterium RIFCSPHIGHO2_01_FULL_42_8]OGT51174.1 MAG: threonine--tRNA ligase [Gammaproteobacteria bacterium RIFCSPHIGHO2_12_FULL_41_25]OGT62936.1 MAG: threonine--tRNA ligase [Gammaproteobacteria bacterium RIFCSPLOWO2_02_FULL_42_14]OGT86068.1 MAG: threonine--tRNA ligase [Gammaproteobacteria bacterium RIFCSPLOWO2_12_FULL_42_18]